jgi:hypothetical protein
MYCIVVKDVIFATILVLNQAKETTAFILNLKNLPEDDIPYWYFDAPNIPNEPRDVSAGAIARNSNSLRCLGYKSRIYFQCLSSGETMKNLGIPAGSESIAMAKPHYFYSNEDLTY